MIGFGIYTPDVPQGGIAPVDALERKLRRIDTVLWYQGWGGDSAWTGDWIRSVLASGRKPLLTWEPHGYALTDVAAGKHDPAVTEFAKLLRGTGGTVYLRFGHEMNANWLGRPSWSGQPAEYVAAWKHLHRVFAAAGATNVRWVWCPNVGADPPEPYWPGASYVGVIGLDGYNFGWWPTPDGPVADWQTFEQVFAASYKRAAALHRTKPIWVCETGCAPEAPFGVSKAGWIREMWRVAPVRFPRLREIVWFSADKERDWRADDTPENASAFL